MGAVCHVKVVIGLTLLSQIKAYDLLHCTAYGEANYICHDDNIITVILHHDWKHFLICRAEKCKVI